MRCSLDEANKSIELIERRTHEEYDSSEEKISAMLAKIKNRHEMEFQKFKEESEAAYENGVQKLFYYYYHCRYYSRVKYFKKKALIIKCSPFMLQSEGFLQL